MIQHWQFARFGTLGDDAYRELFDHKRGPSSKPDLNQGNELTAAPIVTAADVADVAHDGIIEDATNSGPDQMDSDHLGMDDKSPVSTEDSWATEEEEEENPEPGTESEWIYEEFLGSPNDGLSPEVGFTREEDILLPLPNQDGQKNTPANHKELDAPSTTTSVRRLAREFLLSVDELSAGNIELLGEIIEQKGWSSTQIQVRALFLRRTPMRVIHRAWQIRELWQYAHLLHAVAQEEISYRINHAELITWLQAVILIEHFSWIEDPEEIISELEQLADHWLSHPELTRTYPVFKDYLFRYRLTKFDHRHDLGLQINLDPHDERTFDGRANGCLREWWHGDID